jgi:5'-nucleotidase
MEPNILVTNDDGINSPGIKALEESLAKIGRVTVIAPDRERSAVSHSITLHHPLRVIEISPHHFSVDGTPTDCVILGILEFMKVKPDLVVSGINIGPNLGDDITFSGTVAAAMEGTLLGVPSIAMSLVTRARIDFEPAATFARQLAEMVIKKGLPKDTLLNVNVPPLPAEEIKGFRFVRHGKRIYRDKIIQKKDPRGRDYYWIGGDEPQYHEEDNTDFHAIENDYIAITPIHLDLNNEKVLGELQKWKFPVK